MVNMLLSWKPKVKKTIYSNTLFLHSEGKGKWIIGDSESDTYFLIPAYQKDFFDDVSRRLDGSHSINEVASSLNVENNKVISIAKMLYKKDMLHNEEMNKPVTFNEVDKYSISLFKYAFPKLKNKEKSMKITNIIFWLTIVFLIANCALFVFLNIQNGFKLFAETRLTDWLSFGKSDSSLVQGYFLINI